MHKAAADYLAIRRDDSARRVNGCAPEKSLLLLKPAALVSHGGGRRFERDSWQYRLRTAGRRRGLNAPAKSAVSATCG
jgi:hypothetical protein